MVEFASSLNPEVKVPLIVADEDTGPLVKALVHEPAGKNLIGYRAWLTANEIVEAFKEATGLDAKNIHLPKGQFARPLPPDIAEEISEMLQYMDEFGYEGRDDPTVEHPKDVSSPALEAKLIANSTRSWPRLPSWQLLVITSRSRTGKRFCHRHNLARVCALNFIIRKKLAKLLIISSFLFMIKRLSK